MNKETLSHTVLKEIGFELLAEGKTVRVRAEGYSMYPTIKPGSILYIEPLDTVTELKPGEIIAWKRDSGFVVHRLCRITLENGLKHLVTRGDSLNEEDEAIDPEKAVGKVIRIEYPEGITISPEKYLNIIPNYIVNRILVRIILQISKVKRIFM